MDIYAQILDLPMELIEMIASHLRILDIGNLRCTHSQLNSYLIASFAKGTTFHISPDQTASSEFNTTTQGSLPPHVRDLKLAHTHLYRFYDYRHREEDEWRDHTPYSRLENSERAILQRALSPSSEQFANFTRLLSSFSNLRSISAYHENATLECFDDEVNGSKFLVSHQHIEKDGSDTEEKTVQMRVWPMLRPKVLRSGL